MSVARSSTKRVYVVVCGSGSRRLSVRIWSRSSRYQKWYFLRSSNSAGCDCPLSSTCFSTTKTRSWGWPPNTSKNRSFSCLHHWDARKPGDSTSSMVADCCTAVQISGGDRMIAPQVYFIPPYRESIMATHLLRQQVTQVLQQRAHPLDSKHGLIIYPSVANKQVAAKVGIKRHAFLTCGLYRSSTQTVRLHSFVLDYDHEELP